MIKIAIFDQDGTFYSQKHSLTTALRNKTKQWIMKSLNVNHKELESLYLKLPKEYPNPLDGFSSIGLKTKDYMLKVFDKVDPAEHLESNNKLKELLKNLGVKIYVVTISSKKYSKKLQVALGINRVIEKTYSLGDIYPLKKDKFDIYETIRKKERLNRREIVIIGNDYRIDLELAEKKGYNIVLVNSKDKRLKTNNIYSIKKIIKNKNIQESPNQKRF